MPHITVFYILIGTVHAKFDGKMGDEKMELNKKVDFSVHMIFRTHAVYHKIFPYIMVAYQIE